MACLAFGSAAFAALEPTAPKDVDLSGHWKLNAALSEDPRTAVLEARDAKKKIKRLGAGSPVIREPDEAPPLPSGGRRLPRGRHEPPGPDPIADSPVGGADQYDRTNSGEYDPIEAAITAPEEFAIRQEPEAFVLMMTESTDTCEPKNPGIVTTSEARLAERECGWDGNAFVVESKSAQGPRVTRRYELDQESGRLVVTSELKGQSIAKVQVKRVYEPVKR